jgi:hypothetical protein
MVFFYFIFLFLSLFSLSGVPSSLSRLRLSFFIQARSCVFIGGYVSIQAWGGTSSSNSMVDGLEAKFYAGIHEHSPHVAYVLCNTGTPSTQSSGMVHNMTSLLIWRRTGFEACA